LLDFSIARCAARALLRSRERLDFWAWLLAYKLKSRPALLRQIAAPAPHAALYRPKNPKALHPFVGRLTHESNSLHRRRCHTPGPRDVQWRRRPAPLVSSIVYDVHLSSFSRNFLNVVFRGSTHTSMLVRMPWLAFSSRSTCRPGGIGRSARGV